MKMLKRELRKIYLARRVSLPESERKEKSRQIAELFFDNFDLSGVSFLHAFLPIEKFGEIDTLPVFEKIWRQYPRVQTLVPRVNFQTGEIENLAFSPETETVMNAWHIFEPTHDERVEAAKIDLVLVPLLCFDRQGFRAGYGKGFYDKLLAKCRPDCRKIGLSFFAPVEAIADAGDHDIPLDACITPEKIWTFSERGEDTGYAVRDT